MKGILEFVSKFFQILLQHEIGEAVALAQRRFHEEHFIQEEWPSSGVYKYINKAVEKVIKLIVIIEEAASYCTSTTI